MLNFKPKDDFPKAIPREKLGRKQLPKTNSPFTFDNEDEKRVNLNDPENRHEKDSDIADNSFIHYGEESKEPVEDLGILSEEEEMERDYKSFEQDCDIPVEFTERNLDNNNGDIDVASINPKIGEISYKRAKTGVPRIDVANTIDVAQEDVEKYGKLYTKEQLYGGFNGYADGKDNLKTQLPRKRQRAFRGMIRNFLGKD